MGPPVSSRAALGDSKLLCICPARLQLLDPSLSHMTHFFSSAVKPISSHPPSSLSSLHPPPLSRPLLSSPPPSADTLLHLSRSPCSISVIATSSIVSSSQKLRECEHSPAAFDVLVDSWETKASRIEEKRRGDERCRVELRGQDKTGQGRAGQGRAGHEQGVEPSLLLSLSLLSQIPAASSQPLPACRDHRGTGG
eukprot:768759-Hanusia_phi.AAC.8